MPHAILLDLHKEYDALNRSWCLDILEGYGVGPSPPRLLCRYWGRLKMVARAGGYDVGPFCRERGVTLGDLIFPTIFTVVVGAVCIILFSLELDR